MRNAACSNSNVTFLHLLFIFSLGKTERPFNQKKKKKPPSTRLRVLIMNMLSGQGHPDVLWQLENLFASYF